MKLLQRNALTSTEILGKSVSLSPTAAKRRVNKLRKNGVILRDVAITDPECLGFGVFTLVFVNLERNRRDILQNFRQAIENNPRIPQSFSTGDDSTSRQPFIYASLSLTEKFADT